MFVHVPKYYLLVRNNTYNGTDLWWNKASRYVHTLSATAPDEL
jgi:hypothetical protein